MKQKTISQESKNLVFGVSQKKLFASSRVRITLNFHVFFTLAQQIYMINYTSICAGLDDTFNGFKETFTITHS